MSKTSIMYLNHITLKSLTKFEVRHFYLSNDVAKTEKGSRKLIANVLCDTINLADFLRETKYVFCPVSIRYILINFHI